MTEDISPNQSGQVITPDNQSPPPPPSTEVTAVQSKEPQATNWQFKVEDQQTTLYNNQTQPNTSQDATLPELSVRWTASEFINHEKSLSWYFGLALGGVILAGGVYFVTQEYISTIVTLIIIVVFGTYAGLKPRELDYQIDSKGIHISQKLYSFGDFKSFSVAQEGVIKTIMLMPLKRYMPILTLYYDPGDEQKIFAILEQFLPVDEHQPDLVDRLMQRLRF